MIRICITFLMLLSGIKLSAYAVCTPDSVLMLKILDMKRNPASGLDIRLNGLQMAPLMNGNIYFSDIAGVYTLKGIPPGLYQSKRFKIEASGEGFISISDSVSLMYQIYIPTGEVDFFWQGNKIYVPKGNLISMVHNPSKRSISVKKSDALVDSAVACPGLKIADLKECDLWYFTHASAEDQISFLKRNKDAVCTLGGQAAKNGKGLPISYQFVLDFRNKPHLKKEMDVWVEKQKGDNNIHAAETIGMMGEFYYYGHFTPKGVIQGPELLEELVNAFGILVFQELALYPCPG